MPQALSFCNLTERRMDAVAVFKGAARAGGLDARASTPTRSQRPRRDAKFTGANRTILHPFKWLNTPADRRKDRS